MEVLTYTIGGAFVLKPSENITVGTMVDLRKAFESVKAGEYGKVGLDIECSHFIDSSGIGLLTNFAAIMRNLGRQFAIFNIDPEISELFNLVDLQEQCTLLASAEDVELWAGQ